jgi:hypothetical protein
LPPPVGIFPRYVEPEAPAAPPKPPKEKKVKQEKGTGAESAMGDTTKIKGPTSYFPSIEATYGKPISYWMDTLEIAGPLKHMELVALLKTTHAMGHGHANALVAQFLAGK